MRISLSKNACGFSFQPTDSEPCLEGKRYVFQHPFGVASTMSWQLHQGCDRHWTGKLIFDRTEAKFNGPEIGQYSIIMHECSLKPAGPQAGNMSCFQLCTT